MAFRMPPGSGQSWPPWWIDAGLKILLTGGVVRWVRTSSTAVVIGYASSSLLITISLIHLSAPHHPAAAHAHSKLPTVDATDKDMGLFIAFFNLWRIHVDTAGASARWALQADAIVAEYGQYAVLFQLDYTPTTRVNFLGTTLYRRSDDATDQRRSQPKIRDDKKIAGIANPSFIASP